MAGHSIEIEWTEIEKDYPEDAQIHRSEFECPICGFKNLLGETETDVVIQHTCEHYEGHGAGVAFFAGQEG